MAVTPKVKPYAQGNPNPFMPTSGMGMDDENQFWRDLEASNSGNRGPRIPGAPNYISSLDDAGNLKEQYRLTERGPVTMDSLLGDQATRLGGINLNTQGLEAIRSRALGTGDSPWAKLALEQQALDEAQQRDETSRRVGSAYGGAAARAAATGGLTRGAAERMALQRARGTAGAGQDVARGGSNQRLGIRLQDQTTRDEFLRGLPGQELQALEPEFRKASMWQELATGEQGRRMNLDLSNRDYATGIERSNKGGALEGLQGQNTYNLSRWQEMMKAYGADKTAKAIENSGKK